MANAVNVEHIRALGRQARDYLATNSDIRSRGLDGALLRAEAGEAFARPLKTAAVQVGQTPFSVIFATLVWIQDSDFFSTGLEEPNPALLSQEFLLASCRACDGSGNPWGQGEAELRRREGLKGWPRIRLKLQDLRILPRSRDASSTRWITDLWQKWTDVEL